MKRLYWNTIYNQTSMGTAELDMSHLLRMFPKARYYIDISLYKLDPFAQNVWVSFLEQLEKEQLSLESMEFYDKSLCLDVSLDVLNVALEAIKHSIISLVERYKTISPESDEATDCGYDLVYSRIVEDAIRLDLAVSVGGLD